MKTLVAGLGLAAIVVFFGACNVAPAPSGSARWKTVTSEALDGSKTVTVAIAADSDAQLWLTKSRPVLVIRCAERKLSADIYTGSPETIDPSADDGVYPVRVRYDSTAPVWNAAGESTDHAALFFDSPKKVVGKLLHSGTFRVEFTPINASPVIASFRLAGLPDVYAPLRAACGQ